MNIIHFSNIDFGGAGIAAVRYHHLLQSMGHNSVLYVAEKRNTDSSIVKLKLSTNTVSIKKRIIIKIRKFLYRILGLKNNFVKDKYCFYDFKGNVKNGIIPDILDQIDLQNIDIVFVHWLGDFINTYDLLKIYEKTHARFIFSMMDLEPITGGCHYPWECNKYQTNCLDCPAIADSTLEFIPHRQLMAKAINLSYINPDIFSSALYDLNFAKKSVIKFSKYYQLYYPIDEDIFHPAEFPDDFYIFSNVNSPDDVRKGFEYLLQVLVLVDKKIKKTVKFLSLNSSLFSVYKFDHILIEEFSFCNNINDLAKLYQKARIFLCASIEDSAPMMLAEALMTGVPVVSFDTGTAKQFIEDGKQGFVVPRYDVKKFANHVIEIIENYPMTINTPVEIHNKMKDLYGKTAIANKMENILNDEEKSYDTI